MAKRPYTAALAAFVLILSAPFTGASSFRASAQDQPATQAAPTNVPPSNPKPADPGNTTAPTPSTVPANGAGLGVDIHKYIIGAEDLLFIQVWREPDFTRQVIVRPDGKISLPLIGEVQAGGLTPEQFGTSLHEALSKLINNPDVSVSVLEVNSKRYFIDGQVGRPGLYRLITPTTVLEALSESGGFREFANPKKVRILRGTKTYRFNYREVIKGKNMAQNIYLENGDHIIVP